MRTPKAGEYGLNRTPRTWRYGWVVAAWIAAGCFNEPAPGAGDQTSATTSTGTSMGTATLGEGDTTSTSTSAESVDDTTSPTTSVDTTGARSESESSGAPAFDPCPGFVETFDVCPGAPWDASGSGDVTCDGTAVLTMSSAVDGNVQLVLPIGLAHATATVELGDAPGPGVLKMLRIRTEATQIIAFRINGDGPWLEVYVDDMGATDVLASMPHDGEMHRWVRVREEAGELSFQTSADGLNFVSFHESQAPFDLVGATVGIAAGNFAALMDDTPVRFGQFEYACTGP